MRNAKIGLLTAFIMLLLPFSPLPAAGAQAGSKSSSRGVVTQYIQALQKRDYKTIIDLSDYYHQQIASIKAQNPRVLWPKLLGAYYQKTISNITRHWSGGAAFVAMSAALMGDPSQNIRAMTELLPSACRWTISETRRQPVVNQWSGRQYIQETDYVTVTYPAWQDAPLADSGLLKQAILQFEVDANAGLITGMSRVSAGDAYWKGPLRIVNMALGENYAGMNLSFSAVGGASPFRCSVQLGSASTEKNCTRSNHGNFSINFDWQTLRERPPLPVRVSISDRDGLSDQVAFTAPAFPSVQLNIYPLWHYCWVRNPWRQRGVGYPPDLDMCKKPIGRLGGAAAGVAPALPAASSAAAAPPASRASAPPASPPAPTASCGDYAGCLRAGISAFEASNLSAAIPDFQGAANLQPANGDPWLWLGRTYLREGQTRNFTQAWDKALSLGGSVVLGACREMTFRPCERGDLMMSAKSVAFRAGGSQTVFEAPPSGVKTKGVFNSTMMAHASFGLRVQRKNYNFDFFPFYITCNVGLLVQCPAQGIAQQLAVANYVEQAIPKLAAGALAAAAPPPPPAPGLSAGTSGGTSASPNSSTCAKAAGAGYSIKVNGQLYAVKKVKTASGGEIPVFLDKNGAPVPPGPLLHRLEAGAWTHDNIVASQAARTDIHSKLTTLPDLVNTSQTLQAYQTMQDVLVRAMAEAIEAEVTGGASLAKAVPHLVWGTVENQLLNSPRTLFALSAQVGLENSLQYYRQFSNPKVFPPADSTVIDITTLENIKSFYSKAQALDVPNEALASALMPQRWTDLASQALHSVISELLPGLPHASEAVTYKGLLDLQESFAESAQTLPQLRVYGQDLSMILRVWQANNQKIDAWASAAAQACGSAGSAMAASGQIPAPIQAILDRRYPGWKPVATSADYLKTCKQSNPDFKYWFVYGDFNGDGRRDYAAEVEEAATGYLIAFLTGNGGFQPVVAQTFAGARLMWPVLAVAPKGANLPDLKPTPQGGFVIQHRVVPTDTLLGIACGKSGEAYLYSRAGFEHFFISD